MKVTLYQLTEDYRTLENMLESEFITKDDINSALANVKDNIENKVDNIAKLVLENKATVEAIKSEEKRLAARRQAIDNNIEWLKNYLLVEMTSIQLFKVKKDVVTVSIQDNPPSVEIGILDLIPDEYRRVIPEHWEPDKKAILEHFKQTGEIVPGVDLILNKKHVSIR